MKSPRFAFLKICRHTFGTFAEPHKPTRNRMMLKLADEVKVGYASKGGALENLLRQENLLTGNSIQ
ncbi:MAG: hypothetical protein WD016_01005 [Balneolaceae bacterium]